MPNLWSSDSIQEWQHALSSYEQVVAAQGVKRLPELDRWCRYELPLLLAKRAPAYITLDELVRATEWKMARGVWRQRNLLLVKSNPNDDVVRISTMALAKIPDPKAPIVELAEFAGVGPATASAIAAAAAPQVYPFFDELVAGQVPGLGAVKFTLGYYWRYAEALRERARTLGAGWTPALVERALWANAGGKAK